VGAKARAIQAPKGECHMHVPPQRKSTLSVPLFFGILLCLTSIASALDPWERIPDDQPIMREHWPKAVVNAINLRHRVYGGGNWGTGWTFCYDGIRHA
jgi:hypothetical protein